MSVRYRRLRLLRTPPAFFTELFPLLRGDGGRLLLFGLASPMPPPDAPMVPPPPGEARFRLPLGFCRVAGSVAGRFLSPLLPLFLPAPIPLGPSAPFPHGSHGSFSPSPGPQKVGSLMQKDQEVRVCKRGEIFESPPCWSLPPPLACFMAMPWEGHVCGGRHVCLLGLPTHKGRHVTRHRLDSLCGTRSSPAVMYKNSSVSKSREA